MKKDECRIVFRVGSKGVFLFILMVLSCGVALAGPVETQQVKTPRGAMVNVAVNVPDSGVAPHPAVILAPGQGYHMELPIMKELAERLAASGVMAFRFDWAYYSSDPQKAGQPSADLSKEAEDMQAVVNLARADRRVDAAQIVIAGKSMGSVVAYTVFSNNETAKAVVLLTPLCSSSAAPGAAPRSIGAQNYPGLTQVSKPVILALGNTDPACSVPQLYDWLKAAKSNVAVVVTGGDHSLNVTSGTDAVATRRNAENISDTVRFVAHWILLALGR